MLGHSSIFPQKAILPPEVLGHSSISPLQNFASPSATASSISDESHIVEPKQFSSVPEQCKYVVVELFAGILPVSCVCHSLSCPPLAVFFSEVDEDACAVIEKKWPQAIPLGDVKCLSEAVLISMVNQFPDVWWILTGGPPCTDVSLLKDDRAGAFGLF